MPNKVKLSCAATCVAMIVLSLAVTVLASEQSKFEDAKEKGTIEAYEKFLKKYPQGELAEQAVGEIYKLVSKEDSIELYRDFVNRYPTDSWSAQAKSRIEYLQSAEREYVSVDTSSVPDLEAFVSKFPTGPLSMTVREKVENANMRRIREGEKRFTIPEILPGKGAGSFHLAIAPSENHPDVFLYESMYPGDTVPFRVRMGGEYPLNGVGIGTGSIFATIENLDFLSSGSIVRFRGKITYKGCTFNGDQQDPLSFALLDGKGLVYVTGKGKVTLKDGREVTLPMPQAATNRALPSGQSSPNGHSAAPGDQGSSSSRSTAASTPEWVKTLDQVISENQNRPVRVFIETDREAYCAGDSILVVAVGENTSDEVVNIGDYWSGRVVSVFLRNRDKATTYTVVDITFDTVTPSIVQLDPHKVALLGSVSFNSRLGKDESELVGNYMLYLRMGKLISSPWAIRLVKRDQQ
ncbi:MAG: hypothetical protein NTX17_00980 [Candidatus Eisenbacteria bacterium]|nr:hypothetical protein [Candidatus Eisenbacteria bacterium]